jgi:hypothetical protein
MNKLEYYVNQKEKWNEPETSDLIHEYNTSELTISQIGDIHKRTPGSIAFKLWSLKVLENYRHARGYEDYKNGNLYKEICSTPKKEKKPKQKKEKVEQYEVEPKSTNPFDDDCEPTEKITKRYSYTLTQKSIQEEIASLKKDVAEILRLMKAVYEFENKDNSV